MKWFEIKRKHGHGANEGLNVSQYTLNIIVLAAAQCALLHGNVDSLRSIMSLAVHKRFFYQRSSTIKGRC